MTAIADLYSEESYVAAIACRNIEWCRWQDADAIWKEAGKPTGPLLQALNEAQMAYEWAARCLVKARVFWHHEIERVTA